MDYSNKTLRGTTRKYTLGNPLKDGRGGQGTVYTVKGRPNLVAKIYHEKVLQRPSREVDAHRRKLECMIRYNIQTTYNGKLLVAWPLDVLYNGEQMVGYIMPNVRSSHGIYTVWTAERQDQAIKNYSWRKSVLVARNLAQAVKTLHDNDIILGDFNLKNFLVDRSGNVVLVDADSYDITDPSTGEHFPCQVVMQEMLAPELQGYRNLATTRVPFSKSSDDFSLSILIFRLLMGGFHPFNCACVSSGASSCADVTQQAEIVNGNCAYVRDVPGRKISPLSPTLDFLPDDVRSLFCRTFHYTARSVSLNISRRATAAEWVTALDALRRSRLRKCSDNPRHEFPTHNTHCPFCGNKRKIRLGPAVLAAASIAALMWLSNPEGFQEGFQEAFSGMEPIISAIPSQTEPSEYLLPSDQRLLTLEDVEGMTRSEVQLAINEIYARYGRNFVDQEYLDYFQSKSWYQPQPGITDDEIVPMMTAIEYENLHFLSEYRKTLP